MKIEVKSDLVSTRSGVGDNGKPWSIKEQDAYAHVLSKDGKPEPYPQKITLRLQDGVAPYPPGMYTLGDASFYVGQYGRLTLGSPVLAPASVNARVAA